MNESLMMALGQSGAFAAISLAAIGSALGTGAAGCAAVGAWKKCYAQNKPAPFQLVVFAGAPLSQTIYGMIIMFLALLYFQVPEQWPFYLILGVVAGIAMGTSAWMQGKAAAGSCDAFADTEKGFTNDLMALGIIETVAIFVMAFGIVIILMAGSISTPFGIKAATAGDKAAPAIVAKQTSKTLAKFAEPLKSDTELIIDAEGDIAISVFPCDKDGNVANATAPVAAVKMTNGANKIAISSIKTKEKQSLQDGTYIFDIKAGKKSDKVFVQLGAAAK